MRRYTMRPVACGRSALLAIIIATLNACGGGGGGTTASSLMAAATAPVTSATAAANANNASTSTTSQDPSANVTFSVTDYFTGQPISGAGVTLDLATIALTGGSMQISTTPGLHSVQIAASGYATYNGAVQSPT